MSGNYQKYDEDIDIIDLLLILWKAKWTVLIFIILAAITYLISFELNISKYEKENSSPFYESKIFFEFRGFPHLSNKISLFNKDDRISNFKTLLKTRFFSISRSQILY